MSESSNPGDETPASGDITDESTTPSGYSYTVVDDDGDPPVARKGGGGINPLWLLVAALVPVVNLVNGTSIVFETAADRETLDFFHVALARHDVLDAQGAACESWRDPAVEEPCVPMLSFYGGRDELRSRLRSAASLVVDRRQPLDIIRDSLEERGLDLARAA